MEINSKALRYTLWFPEDERRSKQFFRRIIAASENVGGKLILSRQDFDAIAAEIYDKRTITPKDEREYLDVLLAATLQVYDADNSLQSGIVIVSYVNLDKEQGVVSFAYQSTYLDEVRKRPALADL